MSLIDGSDARNISNKILQERESRKRILALAKEQGDECYKDVYRHYEDVYKQLKNCTNDKEREDISKLACVRLHYLLGGGGKLYVDGQLVVNNTEE